ncbi:hypothetical protein LX16_2748 [Stackebrandtia albiflava]|uniref:Excreted virulence factor EspC (Type VII ESX diderm) n=1 Tax=Stackebrandtia albiflava TaxID=406432 RepID=A0A562V2E3_9ACTN|nr:hypothetical protein [Stackebrandtia albiflava]TWJ12003.1 hypothetical protein LX16_2748 [Stackebrandtia albiflava]
MRLSAEEIDALADLADAAADEVRAAGRSLAADRAAPPPGLHLTDALTEVTALWETKVARCAADWDAYRDALRFTADHVVATDEANSFRFPTPEQLVIR